MPHDVSNAESRAMTAGGNRLTADATSDGVPLLQVGELRAFVQALERLEYDVEALLSNVGLDRRLFVDPDALVPCTALGALFVAAREQRRRVNLGAHLGAATPMGAYPLLDYLVLTTDAVRDALDQLQRWFNVTSATYSLRVEERDDSVQLRVEPGTDSFSVQYSAAIVVHHLREETDGRLRVRYLSLMVEPEDRADLERLLGCPVRAPAEWSGIEFPRDAMRVPLRRRDPVLRRVLERQAAAVSARRSPREEQSMSARVRAVLSTRMGPSLPEIAEVARQLAMAPRTLQRRLSSEGVTFKELIDLARRDAAEGLLADRSLAVNEVGYLLGFSEPSAFHRAFRRWKGMTPLEYRGSVEGRTQAAAADSVLRKASR
jgi:AraC-like DNA-binding protein